MSNRESAVCQGHKRNFLVKARALAVLKCRAREDFRDRDVNYVMAISGSGVNTFVGGHVEVVPFGRNPDCGHQVFFPMKTLRSPAAVIRGVIHACEYMSQSCYTYEGRAWRDTGYKLLEKRDAAANAVLANGSWLVFGGNVTTRDSEILEGGRFRVGPRVPSSFRGNNMCSAKINQKLENHCFYLE